MSSWVGDFFFQIWVKLFEIPWDRFVDPLVFHLLILPVLLHEKDLLAPVFGFVRDHQFK